MGHIWHYIITVLGGIGVVLGFLSSIWTLTDPRNGLIAYIRKLLFDFKAPGNYYEATLSNLRLTSAGSVLNWVKTMINSDKPDESVKGVIPTAKTRNALELCYSIFFFLMIFYFGSSHGFTLIGLGSRTLKALLIILLTYFIVWLFAVIVYLANFLSNTMGYLPRLASYNTTLLYGPFYLLPIVLYGVKFLRKQFE